MNQPIRTLVVHDSAGQIRSVVVSSADAPLLTPVLQAGEQCSSVDDVDISLDAPDAELHDQLSRFAENYIVEQSGAEHRHAANVATVKAKK